MEDKIKELSQQIEEFKIELQINASNNSIFRFKKCT